tara:strand:- start:348 stop:611 length:264 start_codon:yes stop_codon:yes gene_type:complete
MLKQESHVVERTLRKAKEDTQLADHQRELALKLQRLNQKCLRQKKQNSEEPKLAARESRININEKSNGQRYATQEGVQSKVVRKKLR